MGVDSAYFENLYNLQNNILEIVKSNYLNLYLTGGTALHRFYYKNLRYSEDLDFFSIDGKIDNSFEIILQNNHINYTIESNSNNFKRFVVEKQLKIDIANDETPHLDDFIVKDGICLDNKDNILSNKFSAILSRSEPRDVYDIYILLKYNNIDKGKIIKSVKEKTADSIDAIFKMLQTFPMNDTLLKDIYFCSDDKKDEFKKDYFNVIDNFVAKQYLDYTNQNDATNTHTIKRKR